MTLDEIYKEDLPNEATKVQLAQAIDVIDSWLSGADVDKDEAYFIMMLLASIHNGAKAKN